MTIDPERVEAVFMDCLFAEGEDHSIHVVCEGVVRPVGMNPAKLEKHRREIIAMLSMLPREFLADGGGGWSFLNACNDKNGEQWTGSHARMEQLFQLGQGIGAVKSLLPRETWPILPGGVPYFMVTVPS